mmetsp:Transcript_31908/g.80924  ORF Transcript_31908/g.80924 Transcript_31908/m.80924 type:complete len:577 (-) Transcript_31908:75-1805(-)
MAAVAMAARQLKRNLTDAMWDREGDGAGLAGGFDVTPPKVLGAVQDCDTEMSPPPLEQSRTPLPVPVCSLGSSFLKDRGAMDPPLQPPPWKRSTSNVRIPSPFATASSPPPQARRSRRTSPPPLMETKATYRSPNRLLTPRVSWSEIVSHSQENLEDDCAMQDCSPRTPRFRLRQPSSPQARAPLRRRPPSDDEGGPTCARDQNEGRLEREFCDITVIGKGQFSTVLRARNCIDRCIYAVKKTTQISRGGLRRIQLREVFALANVSMEAEGCPNIVRYFSSWFEDGRLHIQTELCECSLRDRLVERGREDPSAARFGPKEVVKVLRDVANGLDVLHGCNFVHLDIKPDNILVSRCARENGCYKIADLGLAVAAMGSGCDDISEGDCRYLAKEVLRGDLSDLPKADVFALGLVCYEVATSPAALPCNGEEWHLLRDGCLDVAGLSHLGGPLLELLKLMVHPSPKDRPAAKDISAHTSVAPEDGLQALHEKLNQQLAEAEQTRKLADSYWQELLHFKRQELLSGTGGAAAGAMLSSGGSCCQEVKPLVAGGTPSEGLDYAAVRVAARPRGPRRGRTFG